MVDVDEEWREDFQAEDYNCGYYVVYPKPDADHSGIAKFIHAKNDDGLRIREERQGDKVFCWYNIKLSPEARIEIEHYKGVDCVAVGRGCHLAETWIKQDDADYALIEDSRYKDAKATDTISFVYPESAGYGIYIYVLDGGVEVDVTNAYGKKEFQSIEEPIQTLLSIANQEDGRQDNEPHSHGTMVASKALGLKHGVAKKATLVTVKITRTSPQDDIVQHPATWKQIIRDIEKNGRALNSVVTTSICYGNDLRHSELREDRDCRQLIKRIKCLLDMGVPVVCAAGNLTKFSDAIDSLPAVMEDEEHPVIVVGATNKDGKHATFSQSGGSLTTNASGVGIKGQTKANSHSEERSGTSYSAPQVAGIIATWMSSKSPRWDPNLRGISRVRAIRDCVKSRHHSFKRDSGNVVMIWNGADQDAHNEADVRETLEAMRAQ